MTASERIWWKIHILVNRFAWWMQPGNVSDPTKWYWRLNNYCADKYLPTLLRTRG